MCRNIGKQENDEISGASKMAANVKFQRLSRSSTHLKGWILASCVAKELYAYLRSSTIVQPHFSNLSLFPRREVGSVTKVVEQVEKCR